MGASRLRAGGPSYYPLWPDSSIGGEVYERMLLERLPAHGIDVVLGLPRDHCITQPPAGWQLDVLRHRAGLHWVSAPLVFMPYAMRLLARHRIDLLRGHSVRYTGPSLLMARTMMRSKVPVVLHHHHLYPRWAQLEAAILSRADMVITVSEYSRGQLIGSGVPPEQIEVVLEGVARPPTTSGWRSAWPSDGLRLLQLGRLEERKRPWVAIDAVAAARRSGVTASLVVAGDGPLAQSLVARASELGVLDSVAFVGRVEEAKKWKLYDSAEILLFASTLEGFGLVVAEAQSRGVPVIAAAGTATVEAFAPEESGFLAAPDGAAFAARVAQLNNDGIRQVMGRRARDFARRFDWDTSAEGVADVYRNVVARSSTGQRSLT